MKNWLVLANASRARVIEAGDTAGTWTRVAELVHPASRQKGDQLGDDRPGRAHSMGHGGLGSATYAPHSSPAEHEHERFAQELAAVLDRGVADRRCAGIVLCASNPFLGHVKAHLSERAARVLLRAVPSDYTTLDDAEAAQRIGAL